MALLIVKLIEP